MQFHYVVVSLKSVPRSRLTQGLTFFRPLADDTFYLRYESKYRNLGVDVFVHVIDGVKSESEFVEAFQSILARYRRLKVIKQ